MTTAAQPAERLAPAGTCELEQWSCGETRFRMLFASRALAEAMLNELEDKKGFSIWELDETDELDTDTRIWERLPERRDVWRLRATVRPDSVERKEPVCRPLWEFQGRYRLWTQPDPHVELLKPQRASVMNGGTFVSCQLTVAGLDRAACEELFERTIAETQAKLLELYEPVERTITIWTPREGAEIDESSYFASATFGFDLERGW